MTHSIPEPDYRNAGEQKQDPGNGQNRKECKLEPSIPQRPKPRYDVAPYNDQYDDWK